MSLIAGVLVLTGAVGGGLSWWLRIKMNGLGGRVKAVEKGCTEHEKLLEELRSKLQHAEFDRSSLHERLGEAKSLALKVADDLKVKNAEDVREAMRNAGRLARIEQTLSIKSRGDET